MDTDIIAMWDKLTIFDEEKTPIVIKPENLATPINALVGKLVMKKFMGVHDLQTSLPKIWDLKLPLDNLLEAVYISLNLPIEVNVTRSIIVNPGTSGDRCCFSQ